MFFTKEFIVRCFKHKKYPGKKAPKNDCVDCLEWYLTLSTAPRQGIKATKVFRDKSKYTRKAKHQGSRSQDPLSLPAEHAFEFFFGKVFHALDAFSCLG